MLKASLATPEDAADFEKLNQVKWESGLRAGWEGKSGEEIADQTHEFLGLLQFWVVAAAGHYFQAGALNRLLICLSSADWYYSVLLTPDQEGRQVLQPAQ